MRDGDHDYHVLARARLPRDTVQLARYLVGKIVVRQTPGSLLSGRIVETEAYPVGDAAGHAYRGQTPRSRALEPLAGIAAMQKARGIRKLRDLARGPGRLAAPLGIDRRLDSVDLCREGPLWLAQR